MADDTADERLTVMGLLAEAWLGVTARMSAQLAEHGLSEAEFEILVRLARTPGRRLRMADLTAQTVLSSSGITRAVDRLERAGLVLRRACPTDRRGTFAVLTEAGTEKVDAVLPGHLDLIQTWLIGPLGDELLPGFAAALRVLRDHVAPDATAGAEPAGVEAPSTSRVAPARVPAS
jgi:DNA-binding MarR family transcriptional regulator